jgi:hypothetical protein
MLQLPDGRTLWHRTRREVRTFAGRWPAVAGRFTTGEFPTEATELCIEAFLRGRQHIHRDRVPARAARAREHRPHVHAAVREKMDRWDANTYRRGGPVELGRGRPTEEKESRKTEFL